MTLTQSLSPQARGELAAIRLRRKATQPKPLLHKYYEFRNHNAELIGSNAPEIILTGAAGTGKSLACLYKLHTFASAYPGFRGLLIRKTRESLNESGLVTFERDILGETSDQLTGAARNSRHAYRYPHGSEIVVAGLTQSNKDQRAKILSTEYDLIYVQEATELLEEEWQKLTTRLRNGRAPYQQIIGDCNPDAPSHWVWRRGQSSRLKLWETTHKDNPRLWDGAKWTPDGETYIARLESLTGITRQRLLEGKWVQASGLVYGDVWDDGGIDGNVTEAAEYAPGDVLWAVDDGYAGEYDTELAQFTAQSHPRVFLLCQMRADGTLAVFYESAAVKKLSEAHIGEVLALPYPPPSHTAIDKSAAELRGRLHAQGIYTVGCNATVDESIKNLRDWLGKDANGKRRIIVHPRCKNLRLEMASYRYDPDTQKPIKEFDHALDALRYLVWTLRLRQ